MVCRRRRERSRAIHKVPHRKLCSSSRMKCSPFQTYGNLIDISLKVFLWDLLKGRSKSKEALRAIWTHFEPLRWTAQRAGLFRPFGQAPPARQTIERVWHLARPPLRPPTIAALVLLRPPVGTFFPSLRSRVREKNAPQGRLRQKQWNIKATTTAAATAQARRAVKTRRRSSSAKTSTISSSSWRQERAMLSPPI